MITVGDRVKQRRIELGLTQTELAKKAGIVDKAAISRIEHGGNDITMRTLRRIAPALETTPSILMGWESEAEVKHQDTVENTGDIGLVKKALDLYEAYSNADPGVRAAIELLLKSPQSDS